MTLTAGEPGESVDAERLAVWRMLQRAQVRITRVLETELLLRHDLTLASYDVLSQLSEAPGRRLRMNDLADRVLLSRSGLTRLVDRLQRDGLVGREACVSDARGLFAVLSDAGAGRLAEATPTYLRGIRAQFLDVLDADELRQCAAMLDKLLPVPFADSR
ncbi:DNA-binding MarR family transcriptional regulator [Streptosporangium becharense]|uniref:DNA-binding MarR family transcriptional regulator n=1 Tax=Streptosporangium becharense TaxID=1816182 RepID=A0A7W9II79_9ACTN|nr:MarR family transcriptional regulator [Streptosporangium becharense]MBB2913515.1 DNA-binding MarR family transcriptional regulator [Streptosporangium becharense]MBB5821205.1 DNA-binding MarR family transcriptional regulator [Streptosporangium becharense]